MRRRMLGMLMVGGLLFAATFSDAQPPGGKGGGGGKGGKGGGNSDPDAAVERMFTAFDANKDGKLTREEVTDDRLKDLFDRADTKKAGVVTKDELKALFVKEAANSGGGGGKGGKGGFGGKGGDGGGFGGGKGGGGGFGGGGPGGFGGGGGGPGGGGPPQAGQILPSFVQEMLELSEEQKKKLAELQKNVDDGLAKILTPEQLQKMKEPRGFGGPPKD